MLPLVFAALLAAPVLREPVGRGAPPHDAARRHVAGLLAGPAVKHRSLAIVPLYAPLPSLAEHGSASQGGSGAQVAWLDPELRARSIVEDGRLYLRITNPKPNPVLVPAGTLFAFDRGEAFVARGVVIPGEFAALLPAVLHRPGGAVEYEPAGRATPLATGAALHGGVADIQSILAGWRALGPNRLTVIRRLTEIKRPVTTLLARSAGARKAFRRTVVGAVFLVGNRPVSAHVFGRHDLFSNAFPDLVEAAFIQARQVERAGEANRIRRATRDGDAVAGALAFLRALGRAPGVTAESYAEGSEITLRASVERAVGHAVLARDKTLVHLGYYAIGGYWPRSPGGPGGGADPGVPGGMPPPGKRPPANPTPEESPGVTDRRPRPTLEAERQRDRRPGPAAGGGRGGGNGRAAGNGGAGRAGGAGGGQNSGGAGGGRDR